MPMTFEELLDQALALLRRRGRVTYRTLKLQFNLDDDHLEALKEELLYSQPQVLDEDGRGLVWTGDTSPTSTSPPAATLDIQRALHKRRGDDTSSIQVRLGLNTGLVVVGAIGDNLRMDYTAVGDTTNLAARLQHVAAPGQIVISEATYRLVAGYCDTRS